MNSIQAQNSILDMLKDGVADLFGVKSNNYGNMNGGAPAMEALEDVFKGGSLERSLETPILQKQSLIFEDLDLKMKGGNLDETLDETTEHTSEPEPEPEPEPVKDNENKVYIEVDDFEPIDMDGKEEIPKDDEGDPIEPMNSSEESLNGFSNESDLYMAGGSESYNNSVTLIPKYPFILKSYCSFK